MAGCLRLWGCSELISTDCLPALNIVRYSWLQCYTKQHWLHGMDNILPAGVGQVLKCTDHQAAQAFIARPRDRRQVTKHSSDTSGKGPGLRVHVVT